MGRGVLPGFALGSRAMLVRARLSLQPGYVFRTTRLGSTESVAVAVSDIECLITLLASRATSVRVASSMSSPGRRFALGLLGILLAACASDSGSEPAPAPAAAPLP